VGTENMKFFGENGPPIQVPRPLLVRRFITGRNKDRKDEKPHCSAPVKFCAVVMQKKNGQTDFNFLATPSKFGGGQKKNLKWGVCEAVQEHPKNPTLGKNK